MKILITGNGVYTGKNPSLYINNIHKRFENDFKFFLNRIIGSRETKYSEAFEDFGILTTEQQNDIFDIFLFFEEVFNTSTWFKNYEEKFGEVVEKLLSSFKRWQMPKLDLINLFKAIYSKLVNVIQCVIFSGIPTDEEDFHYPETIKGFDKEYTFNYFKKTKNRNIRIMGHLHGQFDLVRWSYDVDDALIAASGSQNEDDEVKYIMNYHPDILDFEVPMIFGSSIFQKIELLETIKGKAQTNNFDIARAINKKIPYMQLQNDSVNSDIHIFGVSPAPHSEILDWMKGYLSVTWYWYSETDYKQLNEIKKSHPELKIVEASSFGKA